MSITERISRIEEYFINMRVDKDEDAILVLVKFPTNWKISNQQEIFSKYKVQIGDGGNGIFFGTERENGEDVVFDAIDFVVEFNKTLQEKESLLREKTDELLKIFAEETLDHLKALRFVIDEKAEISENKASSDDGKNDKRTDIIKKEEKKTKGGKKNNEDSSLMSFAKEIVN